MTAPGAPAAVSPSAEDLLGELIALLARACADAGRLRVHYSRDGQARCGHREAARLTVVQARVTCGKCLDQLAGTSRHDLKPCGTTAAYRRHKRHGEAACRPCLQANARAKADRRAARKAAGLRLVKGGQNTVFPLEAAA